MAVAAIAIVGVAIGYMLVVEVVKLCGTGRQNRMYALRHTIANEFLVACNTHRNIAVSVKDSLSEYQGLINAYAGGGRPELEGYIKHIDEVHVQMGAALEERVRTLERIMGENRWAVPRGYEVDLGTLKEAKAVLQRLIAKIRVPEPAENVHVEGLFLGVYTEFVQVDTAVGNLLDTYSLERAANYREYLRKDEIRARHVLAVLAAVVTIFFYIVTVVPLAKK